MDAMAGEELTLALSNEHFIWKFVPPPRSQQCPPVLNLYLWALRSDPGGIPRGIPHPLDGLPYWYQTA